MKNKISIIVLILSVSFLMNGQNTPFFKSGDRVCFIGNSITYNGEFHHNILLYHTTRFPDVKFKIFNCGISGDKATDLTNRMDSDILVAKPNVAIVMIGMNDVKFQSDLSTYEKNLEAVVTKLMSKGIAVMLQKPTIYDETTVNTTTIISGKNLALKGAGDVMQKLAVKYSLKTVDYWQIMNDVNNTIHQTAPAVSILRTDRIHPISTGHLLMAYQFIKSNSALTQQLVSKMVIDTDNAISQQQSINCTVNEVVIGIQDSTVLFTALENSLPFPTFADQQATLGYVPFTNDINTESLQIKNLPIGKYIVKIDTTVVGNFTSIELQTGVNLSTIVKTPQYQQAENVRQTLNKLWALEANLRAISYITFTYLKEYSGNKNDVVAVKSYLDNRYGSGYATNYAYMKSQLDVYVKCKPIEKNLNLSSDSLRDETYKAAIPVSHTFKIYPGIIASPIIVPIEPTVNNVIKDSPFNLTFSNTYNPPTTDLGWSSPVNFNSGEFVSAAIIDIDGNHFYRCTTNTAKDDYNHALSQYTSKAILPGKYKLTFRAKADAGDYYLKLSTKTAVSTFLPTNLSDASNGILLNTNKIYITPTTEWKNYSCVFDLNFPSADYVRVFFQFYNKGTYDIDDVLLYPFSVTAIKDIKNNFNVFGRNGSICVSGDAQSGLLEIYSVAGMLLKRANVQNTVECTLAKGIYIVKLMVGKSILGVTKVII